MKRRGFLVLSVTGSALVAGCATTFGSDPTSTPPGSPNSTSRTPSTQTPTPTVPEAQDNHGSGSRDPAEQTSDGWLDGDNVLEMQLPADLRSALGRFVGTESVDTLGAFVGEVRRLTGGGSIAVEALCHTGDETDHWGTVDRERYYFRCFYDAVILAALEDRAVDVHTVSPGGTVVEAHAVGSDELSVTPEGAVFSVGIAADAI